MAKEFELVDVSHSVEDGLVTYKGLPSPVITDHLSREASRNVYAEGTEFHIGKIEMVANTGTYLDTPFHRYARGRDLAELDLYSIANLEGLVVKCREKEIGAETCFGGDWNASNCLKQLELNSQVLSRILPEVVKHLYAFRR